MRGKDKGKGYREWKAGITPAYAGKRLRKLIIAQVNRDHPRLCGEKASVRVVVIKSRGSPPPMRGKEVKCTGASAGIGITPAYAGKRKGFWSPEPQKKDHPRLCGEKSICYDSTRPCPGSPPPMRGKVPTAGQRRNHNGITPAYAGKSPTAATRRGGAEDHPRLCGEKAF